MQGDVTPRAALPIAGATGKPRQSQTTCWEATSCAVTPLFAAVLFATPLRRSCRRRRAARRAARRDAVVDRGGQQPDHPDRRRVQRAVRELAGRARVDGQVPSTVEGYAALQKAGLVPLRAGAAAAAPAAAAAAPPRRPRSGARADGRLHRARRRHALRPRRRRARVRQRDRRDERARPERRAARRHRHQAADRRARAGACRAARARRDGRAAGRARARPPRASAPPTCSPSPPSTASPPRWRPRSPGRRAASTTHGLQRQRARRHAGHAGHVGLRAAEPRASASSNPNSAHDNVTAGVLYLRSLLNQTGGDESAAIAAYYQGLGALRSRGVFDDTAQYVANVQALRSSLRRLAARRFAIWSATGSSRRGPSCYARRHGDLDRTRADLVFLLSQAAHALQTEMTARARRARASRRASHCVLDHALEGEQTQIQLAERCALDKTTMVVTVDELEKAGLAERRPSPTDRRARIIAVTDAGEARGRAGRRDRRAALRRRPRLAARGRARGVRRRALRGSSSGGWRTRRRASSRCAARAAGSSEVDRLLVDHLLRFCL